MAVKIKCSKTEEREFIVPNCFCGAEPEVYEDIKSIGYSYDYLTIYIRCPYCHASTDGTGEAFSQPREKCIELEVQDWINLINRKKKNRMI